MHLKPGKTSPNHWELDQLELGTRTAAWLSCAADKPLFMLAGLALREKPPRPRAPATTPPSSATNTPAHAGKPDPTPPHQRNRPSGTPPPNLWSTPLISVITPTWQRHDLLLQRCIPSVKNQVYPTVEHIIVSDGPDDQLQRKLATEPVQYFSVNHHDQERHWGGPARRLGAEMAHGDLIAYLDDDDTWEPNHLAVLAEALRASGAGFAWSRARVHHTDGTTTRIGDGRPAQGRIAGGSMILIRSEILKVADWAEPDLYEDWILIEKWLKAGIRCASVDEETVDYYPSMPIDPTEAVYVSYPPTV